MTGAAPSSRVVAKAHQFLTFTTSPALQLGVAHGAGAGDGISPSTLTARLQAKRDILPRAWQSSGFEVLPCEGTYFLTAGISGLTNEEDRAFCERLVREAGVAVIPLSVFSTRQAGPFRALRLLQAARRDRGGAGASDAAFSPAFALPLREGGSKVSP